MAAAPPRAAAAEQGARPAPDLDALDEVVRYTTTTGVNAALRAHGYRRRPGDHDEALERVLRDRIAAARIDGSDDGVADALYQCLRLARSASTNAWALRLAAAPRHGARELPGLAGRVGEVCRELAGRCAALCAGAPESLELSLVARGLSPRQARDARDAALR